MIKITETKIANVSKNKFQELKISFIVKKEDYRGQEDLIYSLCESGELGALVFNPIGLKPEDSKSKLLATLHLWMNNYSQKTGTTLEMLKNDVYKRYGVSSRSNLDISSIKKLIDEYKTGFYLES